MQHSAKRSARLGAFASLLRKIPHTASVRLAHGLRVAVPLSPTAAQALQHNRKARARSTLRLRVDNFRFVGLD